MKKSFVSNLNNRGGANSQAHRNNNAATWNSDLGKRLFLKKMGMAGVGSLIVMEVLKVDASALPGTAAPPVAHKKRHHAQTRTSPNGSGFSAKAGQVGSDEATAAAKAQATAQIAQVAWAYDANSPGAAVDTTDPIVAQINFDASAAFEPVVAARWDAALKLWTATWRRVEHQSWDAITAQ